MESPCMRGLGGGKDGVPLYERTGGDGMKSPYMRGLGELHMESPCMRGLGEDKYGVFLCEGTRGRQR